MEDKTTPCGTPAWICLVDTFSCFRIFIQCIAFFVIRSSIFQIWLESSSFSSVVSGTLVHLWFKYRAFHFFCELSVEIVCQLDVYRITFPSGSFLLSVEWEFRLIISVNVIFSVRDSVLNFFGGLFIDFSHCRYIWYVSIYFF